MFYMFQAYRPVSPVITSLSQAKNVTKSTILGIGLHNTDTSRLPGSVLWFDRRRWFNVNKRIVLN